MTYPNASQVRAKGAMFSSQGIERALQDGEKLPPQHCSALTQDTERLREGSGHSRRCSLAEDRGFPLGRAPCV